MDGEERVEYVVPPVGSVWRSREFADWTCEVVLTLRRDRDPDRTHVLIEYEVGALGSGELELDVMTVELFHDHWMQEED